MKLRQALALGAIAAVTAALVACGGGGGGDAGTSQPMGTMRVALTDAPACGYDAVNVTVQKVRVHQSSSANDNDAGWSEIVLSTAKRVDLLSLQNGVLSELGQAPLPAGKYTQLRLVLADNGGASPLANSVVPSGAAETALDTPSAQQTGLKMNVDLDVEANKMLDLVLDFDACKSVVRAGNSGKYNLKPVVRVIPRFVSGVSGTLAAAWPATTTQVSLQHAGVVVKATAPNSAGAFMLQPVAPGTYDLVVTAPGQATVVVTDVVVASDTVTALNAPPAAAIAASASASGVAKGKVTTGATPVDAIVRALQAITGGHTIELANSPVDGATGNYAYTLPTAAPIVAPYVAPPATLTFSADTAAAGKYSLQAASGGVTKSVGPFTLSSGGTATNDFTFP